MNIHRSGVLTALAWLVPHACVCLSVCLPVSHHSMPGVEVLIMKAPLRWTGHVMRMEDSRLPKQICSELARGTRRQGGQTKRDKDSLKNSLRACDTPVKGWEHLCSRWQPLEAGTPQRNTSLRGKATVTARHQTPSQERDEGQASCCCSLPGVSTHLRIGVWLAVASEAPLTSSSFCGGQL